MVLTLNKVHHMPILINVLEPVIILGLPWCKESTGDLNSIPGSGRSPGEEKGNPHQYFCLGNLMDRGAWRVTVHEIARLGHNIVTEHACTSSVYLSLDYL